MLLAPMTMLALANDLPLIEVHSDNTEIRQSARIRITAPVIQDTDGNGVIHIIGDGLVIDFGDAHVRGAPESAAPDTYTGIGVQVSGHDIQIRGGRFSGFKVGLHADAADGLVIDGANVADNFRQRLRSTARAEATEDWLRPHRNDENEWMRNYGAGVYVEDSDHVTIRNVRARNTQNGLVLDRVNESHVYDNDCSFLSGWGLAMWRSNDNTIARNAFDFCVRGYSHGVYNRGQDSAGILLFEQCSRNIIAENSATHGGDGLFGFAGREALGEENLRDDPHWYEGRGNNRNCILANDFSYAVAHGLEMTFSFDNLVALNRFVGNAICGIWGGVSQRMKVYDNHFERNGGMPYGLERGGINIEHGVGNVILGNTFTSNACGIHLWDRAENRYAQLPWGRANDPTTRDNRIVRNRFEKDDVGVHLRNTGPTIMFENVMHEVGEPVRADEKSRSQLDTQHHEIEPTEIPSLDLPGTTRPVGARRDLAGREHIVMTEWGPYDYDAPLLHLHDRRSDRHVYRVLGDEQPNRVALFTGEDGDGSFEKLDQDDDKRTLLVRATESNRILPYRLEVALPSGVLRADDALIAAEWRVQVFAWQADPREDVEAWRREANDSVRFLSPHLQLRYAHHGPSRLPDVPAAVREAGLPADRFGTIAGTTLTFPPGRWRIRTTSDDGIRVWLDDELVIDDWSWHPPTEHIHEFDTSVAKTITLRVEHFELDGYAMLTLDIDLVRQ